MTFATKLIRHRPPHFRHVATIPWESKNSNFCRYSADMEENADKLHLIASNFVIRPQILIFSPLKNGVSFPILIANKIFHVTDLLVIYFCGQFVAPEIRHSRRHCSVCQQSTWYSATRTRFLKSLCLKAYTAKRFTNAFPEKSWTKRGVNKLLQTLRNTGTVYRRPEILIFNFPR